MMWWCREDGCDEWCSDPDPLLGFFEWIRHRWEAHGEGS